MYTWLWTYARVTFRTNGQSREKIRIAEYVFISREGASFLARTVANCHAIL